MAINHTKAILSKHDWIWVAIRDFGLYLLVRAVIAIPNVIVAFMMWHLAPHLSLPDADQRFRDASEMVTRGAWVELASASVQFILFAFIGIYLVRGGGWVFRIVCPPDSADHEG
jgi:hypothetical protein